MSSLTGQTFRAHCGIAVFINPIFQSLLARYSPRLKKNIYFFLFHTVLRSFYVSGRTRRTGVRTCDYVRRQFVCRADVFVHGPEEAQLDGGSSAIKGKLSNTGMKSIDFQ